MSSHRLALCEISALSTQVHHYLLSCQSLWMLSCLLYASTLQACSSLLSQHHSLESSQANSVIRFTSLLFHLSWVTVHCGLIFSVLKLLLFYVDLGFISKPVSVIPSCLEVDVRPCCLSLRWPPSPPGDGYMTLSLFSNMIRET